MKLRSLLCCIVAALGFDPLTAEPAGPASAEVAAAGMLALGRLPSAGETANLTASATLGRTYDELRTRLEQQAGDRHEVAARAYRDAFGQPMPPSDAPEGRGVTYAERIQTHWHALRSDAKRFEEVIRRAYPLVIHREAYPEEIAYWREHGALPFVMLVAAIDNWAKRNQPGLMVTTGRPTISLNCAYLRTVQVPPHLAPEVRQILGLPPTVAEGCTVLAVGADQLLSNGAIVFVASGSER